MKTSTLALAMAALAATGPALAQAGPMDGHAMTREEVQAMALKHFDMIDTDHDGTVSPAEMAAMHGGGMKGGMGPGRPAGPPPQPMTRDAFVAHMLERFDRADANHDGVVDAAEHAAMREQMMHMHGGDGPPPPPPPPPPEDEGDD